ncbi:AraC family transcriptional regulator ligand-binding domain-containing protein [Nocardia sp. NPDC058379]|uniref:AraC family transcriptional regulator n=1 Tax=unclassified Nocardia TaxID=2637762 RepID=UPI00365DBC42
MDTQPRPWWDQTRSGIAARILLDLGEERGISPAALLAGSGLRRTDLDDPATEIEGRQELAIARNLLRVTGDRPGLGAQAGSRYTLGSFGIWGFTMLTSPTVRDLAKLGTRYAGLSFAFIRPRYLEDDTGGRVVYDADDIPDDVRSFFVERELAKILTLEPFIVGARPGFHVETSFDDTRADALHRLAPRRSVLAGYADHALVFSRELLDSAMPQGDPVVVQAMEAQCAELLQKRRRRRGVAAQVRERIFAQLPTPPGMEAIAHQLRIDERTLRRRLSAEGTSYRELVDEVRTTLAVELLVEGRLTVDEVAVRLGYHDSAAFSRAFKRWTGSRPGHYRVTSAVQQCQSVS